MTDPLQPIQFVRHGCVCFSHDDTTLYVDPFYIRAGAPYADYIIVEHSHGDHYSPKDIRKIIADHTVFYATPEVCEKLRADFSLPRQRMLPVREGDFFALRETPGDAITCRAVPAYNKNHPRGFGFGTVLQLAGHTYYLSGDTDTLDKDTICDVLFCVCDAKYNMPDYLDHVPAEITAMHTRPGLVVPYHYTNANEPGHGEKLAAKLEAMGIPSTVL